jgi:uncharacterized protein (TIGR02266 family)
MSKASVKSGAHPASEAIDPDDRRRSERTPFVVRVDYGTVDAFFSEFTTDVNEGGLFIETETPEPSGTAVLLQFRIPGSDGPIKLRGRVVWTSAERSSEIPGMGIEFEDLDVRTRAKINDVVRRLRAEGAQAR